MVQALLTGIRTFTCSIQFYSSFHPYIRIYVHTYKYLVCTVMCTFTHLSVLQHQLSCSGVPISSATLQYAEKISTQLPYWHVLNTQVHILSD